VLSAPEADGVTSTMRAEHYAAVGAVARVLSRVARTGLTRDEEIHAAIGTGHKAAPRRCSNTGSSRIRC